MWYGIVFQNFITNHSDTDLSRSNEGGNTWLPLTQIYDANEDLCRRNLSNCERESNQTINNMVGVLPIKNKYNKKNIFDGKLNGSILNFMVRIYAKPTATILQYEADRFPYKYRQPDIAVIHSKDKGYI